MTTEKIFDEALKNILSEDEILKDEPMKHHTTFRVGGPAEYYLRPKKEQVAEVLRLCLTYQKEYLIIGNGSNLLVSDKGISGVVIEIGKQMDEITVDGTTIYAQAGAMLSKTAHAALEAGLTGMEFAAGIPGCVGGAVVMNAGAYGGEMKDILKSVTVLTADGQEKELTPGELDMSYRHSSITEEHYMVLGVTIALEAGSQEQIRAKMEELKEKRVEKQPLEYPSAGSTFKRPEGYFAGKLIMDAGLRGFQVGGAAVSEKHCGFVINKEKATASDVYRLIQEVQQEVYRQFGVELETEVKMVGEFR